MATNLQLIDDALSLIGVLPEGMTATAEQGDLGMRLIGEIVDEWNDDLISVSWASQSDLSEPCGLFGGELTAVKYELAVRLCAYFGREPALSVLKLAGSTYGKLQANQLVRSIEPVTTSLPLAEGGIGTFNIITGTVR